MRNISIIRYDNMSPDHKRNVRFSIESCNEFCSYSDLERLQEDLASLNEFNLEIINSGYSQHNNFEPKGVNVQLEREISSDNIEFVGAYVSGNSGLLSFESIEEVKTMCNMIESVRLNVQEE